MIPNVEQNEVQNPNAGAQIFQIKMVPNDFVVPDVVETETFRLRPITLQDTLMDWATIAMDYPDHVRNFLPEPPIPEAGYLLETNVMQLGWHQMCHENRNYFTYLIFGKDPAKPEYRGAIYFFPSPKIDHDVAVYLWITKVNGEPDGFEEEMISWGQQWLKEAWPFESPVWPGKLTSWDDYKALPGGRKYESQ